MKGKAIANRIICAFLIISLTISLTSCTLLPGRKAESGYTSYYLKAYLYNGEITTLDVLFIDGLNIPYINMQDYFENIFDSDFTTTASKGGVITVTGSNGSAVFNADNNTVTFDRYEDFIACPLKNVDKNDTIATKDYVVAGTSEQAPYTFDFGKYNIDIIEEEGKVYMPISSANLLVETTYEGALYYDGDIYFTETYSPYTWINQEKLLDDTAMDASLIELNYNELCFMMDNIYGRPEKCYFSEAIARDGFDKALETYDDTTRTIRELLKSNNVLEYYYGLRLLELYLEDGGHSSPASGYTGLMQEYDDSNVSKEYAKLNKEHDKGKIINNATIANAMNLYDSTKNKDWYKQRTKYISLYPIIATARHQALNQYSKQKSWDEGNITLYSNNDTLILSFDQFSPDVFEPMMWTLNYANGHNIKNLVIDVTHNGGGSLSTLVWLINVLTSQKTAPGTSALTGNKLSIQALVDKNLDEEYDDTWDNDNYIGNLKLAILTSGISYSCANILPTVLHDNKIPVLGERSNGGTCDLIFHLNPYGVPIQVSGQNTFTNNNYERIDDGVPLDYTLIRENASSVSDYLPLYDINTISKDMNEYYSRH